MENRAKSRAEHSRIVVITLSVAICLMSLACGGTGNSSAANSGGNNATQVQFTSPVGSAAIDQGQSISLTVSAAVTWSLQGANGKPVGQLTNTTATSATYVSPASVTTAITLNVIATSVANPTVSAALPISIEPLPQITSTSPTPGGCPAPGTVIAGLGSGYGTVWTVGTGGLTYYLEAAGGASPYTWSIASGTLPAGLSMGTPTSSQTVIYGNPTTPGCSNITLQATDAAGVSVTSQYYIVVLPPSLVIEQPPLAVPEVGVAYPPRRWPRPMARVLTSGT